MAYVKRLRQLKETLRSYVYNYGKRADYEVIIGEDVKNVNDKREHDGLLELVGIYSKHIKLKHIQTNYENCYNPAPIYNECIRRSKGEFLVLTNPEVCHKNNILLGFDQELEKNKNVYVVPSCENVNNLKFVEGKAYYDHYQWYHHTKYRMAPLHWCNVISKENYYMIGGFDNKFMYGIACEDDDFLDKVKQHKKIKIVLRDDLEVLHAMHQKMHSYVPDYKFLHKKNIEYNKIKRTIRAKEGLFV